MPVGFYSNKHYISLPEETLQYLCIEAAPQLAKYTLPPHCWADMCAVKALPFQCLSQSNNWLRRTTVFTLKCCAGPRPAFHTGLDFSSWHKACKNKSWAFSLTAFAWAQSITFNFKALSWNEARKNIYMLKPICLNEEESGGLIALIHSLTRDSNKHLWG